MGSLTQPRAKTQALYHFLARVDRVLHGVVSSEINQTLV